MASIRANLLPGLVLWAVAAAVVLVHGLVPASLGIFDTVAGWKATGGFGYSIAATALFAGVLPFLFQKAMPSTRAAATWATLIFTTLLWAYRGFEIDLFYRFQAVLFGSDPTPATVAAKVAVDLFLYNVLWAARAAAYLPLEELRVPAHRVCGLPLGRLFPPQAARSHPVDLGGVAARADSCVQLTL